MQQATAWSATRATSELAQYVWSALGRSTGRTGRSARRCRTARQAQPDRRSRRAASARVDTGCWPTRRAKRVKGTSTATVEVPVL